MGKWGSDDPKVVPEAIKAALWDWYDGRCSYEQYVQRAMAALRDEPTEDAGHTSKETPVSGIEKDERESTRHLQTGLTGHFYGLKPSPTSGIVGEPEQEGDEPGEDEPGPGGNSCE